MSPRSPKTPRARAKSARRRRDVDSLPPDLVLSVRATLEDGRVRMVFEQADGRKRAMLFDGPVAHDLSDKLVRAAATLRNMSDDAHAPPPVLEDA